MDYGLQSPAYFLKMKSEYIQAHKARRYTRYISLAIYSKQFSGTRYDMTNLNILQRDAIHYAVLCYYCVMIMKVHTTHRLHLQCNTQHNTSELLLAHRTVRVHLYHVWRNVSMKNAEDLLSYSIILHSRLLVWYLHLLILKHLGRENFTSWSNSGFHNSENNFLNMSSQKTYIHFRWGIKCVMYRYRY